MKIKFFTKLSIILLVIFHLGGWSSSAIAQEPPTPSPDNQEQPTSAPTAEQSQVTSNTEPLKQDANQGMDKWFAIAAGAVSVLSLGTAVWSLYRVSLLEKLLRNQKSQGNDRRSLKTTEQYSVSVSQLEKIEGEVVKLKQRIQSMESRSQSNYSETPSVNVLNAPVQDSPANQGIFSDSTTGHARIWPEPQQSYPTAQSTRSSSQPIFSESNHLSSSGNVYAGIVSQYNQRPDAIEASGIGVSETQSSIDRRRLNSEAEAVTLVPTSNYSYSIIQGSDHIYWLVPRSGLKMNIGTMDSFNSLFEFQGNPSAGKLHLEKPAQVLYRAETNEWDLAEKGKVVFM
jgi:hypothetical protein